MKTYAPRRPRRALHIRVPAFAPVPLRARRDGWTHHRQAAFLGALAETGSVLEAARRVGMARESAYRLRRRPGAESFAAAWDAVLGRAAEGRRKVTDEELAQRAIFGVLKPLIYAGKHVATIRKPDNSALLRRLAQLDRAAGKQSAASERSQSFTARSASPFERDEGERRRPRKGREALPGDVGRMR